MGLKLKKRHRNNPFKPKNTTDVSPVLDDASESKVTDSTLKSKKEKYLIKNQKFSANDLGLDLKNSEKHGAVYIGCLPFGFYDSKLRNYLQQFGEVTKMNVVRSKKTGKPLGYAFIEFKHENVAKIVAKTMNNYLMFKKLLKCEFISHEEIGKNMFAVNPNNTPELCKGTTRRDKNQSWLEKPRGRKFVDKQKMKVLRTLKKMESMGLDIDSNLVQIKREDLEKIAKKGRENRKRLAEKRKLEKQNKDDNLPETPSKDVSPETSNNSPEKIELVTGKKLTKKTKKAQVKKNVNTTDKEESVKEKKAKSVKKNQNSRVSPSKRKVKQTTDQVDESIASKKRNVKVDESTTANKRAKTAKKSPIKKSKKIPAQIEVDETTTINKRAKTAKKSPIKKSKKTPDQIEVDESTTTTKNIKTSPMKKPSKKNRKLTMNIEEVDEEIIIKTPPNVVKRVKAGKQTVICDATASTVIKTVKRSVTKPLESVSQNLFVGGKKSSPGQFVKLNQGRKRSLKEDTEGVQNSEKKNAGVQNNKKQNAGVQNIKKQKTGVENSKKQTPNKPQRVLRAKSVKSPKTI